MNILTNMPNKTNSLAVGFPLFYHITSEHTYMAELEARYNCIGCEPQLLVIFKICLVFSSLSLRSLSSNFP